MRINKYIAHRLGVSRRKADSFIDAGRITVDGKQPSAGIDISDENTVLIDGRKLPENKNLQYVILHKPENYVCSRNGQGSASIYDLLPHSFDHLNPVGRLDKDSSGLLLLTNDGELHNQLTHPSHQKEKRYETVLNKPLSHDDLSELTNRGIKLSDGLSKFAITPLPTTPEGYTVSLREGRNRQIRRTFNALGYKIVSLKRTQFGEYKLGNLAPGGHKEVQPKN